MGVEGGNVMPIFLPNLWYPNDNYPLSQQQINWGRDEDTPNVYVPYDLLEVNHSNRRRAHWNVRSPES